MDSWQNFEWNFGPTFLLMFKEGFIEGVTTPCPHPVSKECPDYIVYLYNIFKISRREFFSLFPGGNQSQGKISRREIIRREKWKVSQYSCLTPLCLPPSHRSMYDSTVAALVGYNHNASSTLKVNTSHLNDFLFVFGA